MCLQRLFAFLDKIAPLLLLFYLVNALHVTCAPFSGVSRSKSQKAAGRVAKQQQLSEEEEKKKSGVQHDCGSLYKVINSTLQTRTHLMAELPAEKHAGNHRGNMMLEGSVGGGSMESIHPSVCAQCEKCNAGFYLCILLLLN